MPGVFASSLNKRLAIAAYYRAAAVATVSNLQADGVVGVRRARATPYHQPAGTAAEARKAAS